MGAITATQLKVLFPAAADDYLAKVAAELNTDLVNYGLDTGLRQAHFFAQVMQEAGVKLAARDEILNYDAAGLISHFSYYKIHRDEAEQDGYIRDPITKAFTRHANQEAIGNKAYGSNPDLGNRGIASGDGYRFRGRGFIQVTGRANYTTLTIQYGKIYGTGGPDFVADPDPVASFPMSVRSAVCYWIQHGCPAIAAQGSSGPDVDAVTKKVNPGTNDNDKGLRRGNFIRAFQVFGP